MHREWIEPLLQFIHENSQASSEVYPKDLSHPIYRFTPKNAQDILNPLFQSLSESLLTEKMIDLVTFDKIHDNLRIVPSFNAIHWLPEYIEMAFPLYPTPKAKELMQEYEDYVAKNISQDV